MNLEEALRKRKELESRVLAKVMTNDEYRKRFQADPKAVLEAEVGQPLPAGVKVTLVDEDPGTITIVVPPKIALPKSTGELTDEALEQVAGGGNVGVEVAIASTLIVAVTAVA